MIKKMLKSIKNLINIPKTLYLNFKCLKFKDAMKLPIKVNHNIKLGKIYKGCIEFNCDIYRDMIKIGFSGAGFVSENKSYFAILNGGKIIFNGEATIAEGLNIYINHGKVEFGKEFYANRNLELQSEENIKFGENNLLGWNVSIRDTDGHKIIKDGIECTEKGNILFGNNVWIASRSIILKNSNITDGSIIGCNSLVCGERMQEKNCLLAGCPAKVRRNNISWKK